MNIDTRDLGKIVELALKPEWGPGIITKLETRFVHIIFRDCGDKIPKKYFLSENPLAWAANQDQPDLVKLARAKNRKIKAKPAVQPAA